MAHANGTYDEAALMTRPTAELNRLGSTVIIATHNQGLVDRFDHPQIRIAEGRVGLVERVAGR